MCGRGAFAADWVFGWTDRGGAARAGRLGRTAAWTGATAFSSLQQLPGPWSFGVSGGGAAAAGSARGTLPGLGTETETSTGAVETDTATFPTWTSTETPGMLMLT